MNIDNITRIILDAHSKEIYNTKTEKHREKCKIEKTKSFKIFYFYLCGFVASLFYIALCVPFLNWKISRS